MLLTTKLLSAALALGTSYAVLTDGGLSDLVTRAKAKLLGIEQHNDRSHRQAAKAFFELEKGRPPFNEAELSAHGEYLDIESKEEQTRVIEGALPEPPGVAPAPQ